MRERSPGNSVHGEGRASEQAEGTTRLRFRSTETRGPCFHRPASQSPEPRQVPEPCLQAAPAAAATAAAGTVGSGDDETSQQRQRQPPSPLTLPKPSPRRSRSHSAGTVPLSGRAAGHAPSPGSPLGGLHRLLEAARADAEAARMAEAKAKREAVTLNAQVFARSFPRHFAFISGIKCFITSLGCFTYIRSQLSCVRAVAIAV